MDEQAQRHASIYLGSAAAESLAAPRSTAADVERIAGPAHCFGATLMIDPPSVAT
jgi:hypothetical protein